MNQSPDDLILRKYDQALSQFGDTAQGAHWSNDRDRITRFEVMLAVMNGGSRGGSVLCDLACGTGELLTYIKATGWPTLVYVGADRSSLALSYAREKHPEAKFVEIDVNSRSARLEDIACDYLVCNGLFTVKWELSDAQMWTFMETTVRRVWPFVRRGIAFNVMSKIVDWQRDDLFHVSMDDIARLLHELAGRRVTLRADYGLYEFTAYAYRGLG